MTKILLLSNSYPHTVSGVSTVVSNILSWLKDSEELAIICPNSSTKQETKSLGGVTHYFLPSYPTVVRKDVRFITPSVRRLQEILEDFSPDVIHLHDPSPASFILKELAVKNKVKVIFSHHFTSQIVLGYLPPGFKDLAQNNDSLNTGILQLVCKIYENADLIITPTNTIKKALVTHTNIPIKVISSGVDLAAFDQVSEKQVARVSNKYNLPKQDYIFYVGRLDPDKSIEKLLHALATITLQKQQVQLVICGSGGSSNSLKKLSKDLGIDNRILWTGNIPQQDLPAIYKNPHAKIFTIPSPIESQSIVTLMACASSLPVVAAKNGALPEIVHDGKNGYLVNINDPQSFADRISELLSDPARATLFGKYGRQLVEPHNFTNIIQEYQSLYQSILTQKPAP